MEFSMPSVSALTFLTFGLVLGFKHAIEVDHVVVVSSIVSQHRSIWRSAGVGLLWGAGHTASLFVIGVLILIFKITIPEFVSGWFEFGVALMIVLLGALAVLGAIRTTAEVRYHEHNHPGRSHIHLHFHETGCSDSRQKDLHSHYVSRIGLKPFVVGSIHGLAGSAAVTLLILPQIESILLGLSYLLVFGFGSVGGMLLMSLLVGIPFAFASRAPTQINHALQFAAGGASVAFGLWYAYQLSTGSP